MSGFFRCPPSAWPIAVEAYAATVDQWSEEMVIADLAWWLDRVRVGQVKRMPGRPVLRKRWGWTDYAVRTLLQDEPKWKPTAARQNTDSLPTATQRAKPDNEPKTDRTPTEHRQQNSTRVEKIEQSTEAEADRTPPKPPSRGAGPWEGLTSRQRSALASAGVSSLDVAAAMTRSELRARPGIGTGTVKAVEAVLAGAGLRLRPEPEAAPRNADEAVLRAAGSVFGRAYVRQWCGLDPDSDEAQAQRYPWQWRQRDRSQVRSWCEALGLSTADDDMGRLRASVEAYMADCKAGTAFPRGEPPTVGQFTRQLAKYAASGAPMTTNVPSVDKDALARRRQARRKGQAP